MGRGRVSRNRSQFLSWRKDNYPLLRTSDEKSHIFWEGWKAHSDRGPKMPRECFYCPLYEVCFASYKDNNCYASLWKYYFNKKFIPFEE